ncbi:MAG: hypothetical protein H0W83_09670 [Planctomycetes bacterium]|nr:hypothetical protein [Planctomycetota bacterium]
MLSLTASLSGSHATVIAYALLERNLFARHDTRAQVLRAMTDADQPRLALGTTNCRSCHDARHHPSLDPIAAWAAITHGK